MAREFGLPSLVAVHNATMTFKTGDFLRLDASRGLVSKIEELNPVE